ncbi:type II toxin-antitoxin system VapC family toxin [Oleiharenicola lentus]|uniref:type II toxin-antitoxin system VapC family toxin n=1 Tax=Oleiharenicola lentus TaxID=2508720 RepID=UPI003F6684A2
MYLDTSVAVKLFIPEPDSDECELIVGGLGFFSSDLLIGELRSASLGKERSGHLSPASRIRIWERFEEMLDTGMIDLVPLTRTIVSEAAEVMMQLHPAVPLRTLDAIHLATYLSVDAGPLFTCDRRMLDAAKLLGIPLAGV